MKPLRVLKIILIASAAAFAAAEAAGYALQAFVWSKEAPASEAETAPPKKPLTDADLKNRNAQLESRISALAPRGYYIIMVFKLDNIRLHSGWLNYTIERVA